EELAAAASASGDATGNAPNNLADPSKPSITNSAPAIPEPAAEMSANNMPPNDTTPPVATKPTPAEAAEARRREDRLYANLKVQSLIDLPPDQRYKTIIGMSADEQVAFADSLRGGKGQ